MKQRYLFPAKIHNVTQLLGDRSYYNVEQIIKNRMQSAPQFMQRLELDAMLEGHNGCVNCLEWSDDGRLLASASDDYHVMVWDPFRKKRLIDLQTPHSGNIFSVKFLPKTSNSVVVTGAADSRIYVFDLERNTTPIFSCQCHGMRVKRLATAPETPFLFWSSAEDGNVLQIDTREPHNCLSLNDRVLLIRLVNHVGFQCEIKCIAINPRRPEMLAVGANDSYARVYDRRKITPMNLSYRHNITDDSPFFRVTDDNIPKDCVSYYCPGHFNRSKDKMQPHSHTYLTFSPDGTELLVNMGAEQIYLYDLANAKPAVFFNLPQSVNNEPSEEQSDSPKYKYDSTVEKLKKAGNDFLENENYLQAINQYTLAINLASDYPLLYLNRATALMRRNWYGDVYAALRDCHIALRLDPGYVKAHFRLARALLELGYIDEANECLEEMKKRFPTHANNSSVMMLKKDIASATEAQKSYSMDSMDALSETEMYWRSKSLDYEERFIGHCNTTTDIKEANFFGSDGNYIVAGSDDGNFFIWQRHPTNVITNIYNGDMAIVNCVQPHPYLCMLATSGIDHEIRLWSPQPEENFVSKNKVLYFDVPVVTNQHRMQADIFDLNSSGTMCRTS